VARLQYPVIVVVITAVMAVSEPNRGHAGSLCGGVRAEDSPEMSVGFGH
jgi:hypothetical protein